MIQSYTFKNLIEYKLTKKLVDGQFV